MRLQGLDTSDAASAWNGTGNGTKCAYW